MSNKLNRFFTSNGVIIVILLIVTNISIFFNIPFLREIFSILYLTILPGLIILILLKLDKLDIAKYIVLTLGASIAFLILFGWGLNQALLQMNNNRPLTTGVLLTAINAALAILLIIAYFRNKQAFYSSSIQIELNETSKWFVLSCSLLPIISILGTDLLNSTDNNSVLIILLFIIPILIILFSIFNKKISPDAYPLVLAMIGASLLFMFWLRSPHILGHDIHNEYYFFQLTLNNGHWAVYGANTLDSCLSISILPTIFQSFVHLSNQEFLFKGVFTLLCTFLPVTIFVISRKYIGDKFSFLAAFYFASQSSYLMAPGNARTNVAIFFFALCILVLFLENIGNWEKRALFLVFVVSTVVSHYSTTYIFFFLFLSALILSLVFKKFKVSKVITWAGVAFLAVVGFLWFSQVVVAPYNVAVRFLDNSLLSFQHFFMAESRTSDLGLLFGYGIKGARVLSYLQSLQSITLWITFLFIAVGVAGTFFKHKDMIDTSLQSPSKAPFLNLKFETDYFLLGLCGGIILVASLIIPFVSLGYDLIRVYEQMAVFLSVFLVTGGILLSKFIKINAHVIILVVLIPYFLFTTFAAYEVFGIHRTFILDAKSPDAAY